MPQSNGAMRSPLGVLCVCRGRHVGSFIPRGVRTSTPFCYSSSRRHKMAASVYPKWLPFGRTRYGEAELTSAGFQIPYKWLLQREDDTAANCHIWLSKLIMDLGFSSLSCEGLGCACNYLDISLTHIMLLSMSFPLVANRLSAALWYSRCQRRIKTTTIAQTKGQKTGYVFLSSAYQFNMCSWQWCKCPRERGSKICAQTYTHHRQQDGREQKQ